MAADLQTIDHDDANVIHHAGIGSDGSEHRRGSAASNSAHSPTPSSHPSTSRAPSPSSPELAAARSCGTHSAAHERHPLSPAPPRKPSPLSVEEQHTRESSPTFAHSLPVPASPSRPPSPIRSHSPPEHFEATGNKRRRTSSVTSPASSLHQRSHSEASSSHPHDSSLSTPSTAFIPYAREFDVAERAVPNLIGALHTNAFRLKDEHGKQGIFFVFHDLSVRIEGAYKLKLKLMSIGNAGKRTVGGTAIVAAAHSDSFNVTSAKRFEGMLDPTNLSKTFAKQGVRIPTRRVARTRRKAGGQQKEEEGE